MYPKLLPHLKRFIFVRQGAFNRYYEGKLTAVDDETIQIQSYKKDGSEEELWTISLETITEFSLGGRHLTELELKVSFLASDSNGANLDVVEEVQDETIDQGIESQVDEI